MISKDLTRSIKDALKTAKGQLGYILDHIDNDEQAENMLLQIKAVQAILTKSTFELLDETYRKALAEKISAAYQNCPGNCGNEAMIEHLRRLFPDIKPEEVPKKLREARKVEEELKKYLSEKVLTPLPPLTDL